MVAISIPIFTSQLEKARESTDAADIRDYYAEITTDLLTGDLSSTSTTCQVGNNLTATATYDGSGKLTKVQVTGWKAHQTQSDWISKPTIAGVEVSADFKGKTTITYTFLESADGDAYVSAIAP